MTALAASLVLLIGSSVIGYFGNRKTEKVEMELNSMAIQYGRLKERQSAQNDSLIYYREKLVQIQKLIVVQELTLKNPPNEKEVFVRFSQMPDSTAIRIFTERYARNGMFGQKR